jgi:AcrR family transcriptional regulator
MDRKGGRTERQDEARARILEAARTLFEEKGGAGLSIRAIAARAGMPAMTLYSHFPSKTAIIRGLWSLAFDPLFTVLQAAEAAATDDSVRLRQVALAYVEYWLQHPDRYRLVFLIEDRKDGQGWFIDETNVVPAYLRFGPLIVAARGASDGDPRREAEALVCALTGVVHLLVTVSEYSWAPAESYVDAILRGFTKI